MKLERIIRDERIKQGLSHEKLAMAAGVSKRAIIYWEHGEREISLENADKVLKALNVSLTIGA